MNSMVLLEAIGQLDEDLLERSERAERKLSPKWISLAALAACLCMVLGFGLQFLSLGKKSVENAGGMYQESVDNMLMDTPQQAEKEDSVIYPFAAQAIQTTVQEHAISVINSREELDLLAANDSETAEYFAEQYDEEFFAQRQLLILTVKGEGTAVPEVTKLYWENALVVEIHWDAAQQTEATIGWTICIEVQKGLAQQDMVKLRQYVTVAE